MVAAGNAEVALGPKLLRWPAVQRIRVEDLDGIAERVVDDIIPLVDVLDGLLQVGVGGASRRNVDCTGSQPAPQPELVRALRSQRRQSRAQSSSDSSASAMLKDGRSSARYWGLTSRQRGVGKRLLSWALHHDRR